MSSAGWELQKAVYEALVTALDPVKVYDAVPQDDDTYPRVNIGDDTHADWSTKTENGEMHTLTIHAWSREQGNKEALNLMKQIYDTLHKQTLALTGHHLVLMQYEFSEVMLDPDGVTRHGVTRFRILTHEA